LRFVSSSSYYVRRDDDSEPVMVTGMIMVVKAMVVKAMVKQVNKVIPPSPNESTCSE
jgi:hypothetical protein